MIKLASNREAKVKFTAETGEFNNAIKQANSTLSLLRSELKQNSTAMKGAGDSVDLLTQRQKILAQEMEASRAKTAALEAKLNTAKSIFGENATEVQKLQTQLINAQTAEMRMQQELDGVNSSLQEQRSAASQAESAWGQLTSKINQQESDLAKLKNEYKNVVLEQGQTSSEAKQLASAISSLNSDLSANKQQLSNAERAADQLADAFDEAEREARDLGGGLDVTDVAIGNLAADGIGSMVESLVGLEEQTRQYRSEQAKLETAAQTQGKSIDELKGHYTDLYSITADETLASTAALNMSQMGLSVDQTNSLLNSGTGIWAAYGDSIPLDGLMESVNECSKLGTTLTGPLTDAINWASMSNQEWSNALSGNSKAQSAFNKAIKEGLPVEDAFNQALAACSTEQERQQLILDALDGAYGEMGTTYKETNADVISANEATANLTDAQAKLGEAIAPVQSQFTNLIAGGLSWLADNLPTVVPIVSGLGVAIGGLWIAFKGATIIDSVKNSMAALNAVMKANPIILIVSLIAGLVVALVGLYNTNEDFRNAVNSAWQAISGVVGGVVEWFTSTALPAIQGFISGVVGFFQGLWTTAQEVWNGIYTAVSNFVNGVITFFTNIYTTAQTIWTAIGTVIQTVVTTIQTIISTVLTVIQTVWSTIWGAISLVAQTIWTGIQTIVTTYINYVQTVISTVLNVISSIWSTIWNTVSSVASTIWNTISSVISTVINTISSVISSVLSTISGVWSSIWNTVSSVASSVWNGISSTISSIINGISSTISSVFNGVKNTVSNVWNGIKSTISGAIDGAKNVVKGGLDAIAGFFSGIKLELPKIKLPHFSISGSFSLNPPSIPHIGVEWYAEGGILNMPTVFGMNGNNLMVGGEAGTEVVSPLDKLQGFIDVAVQRNLPDNSDLVDAIEELANRVISIEINGKQMMKATASDSDRVNGSRQNLINRRLSVR